MKPTSRVKTNKTLVEKLKRTPRLRLSGMRDIGGARIVRDMNRRQQDELVAQIVDLFPGAKVIDRRANPNQGYRAVHVLIRVNGARIEIQVRTDHQHLWAELAEKLGDVWGRQIRYGGDPRDPHQPYGGATRQDFWVEVQRLADLVEMYELAVEESAQLEADLAAGAQVAAEVLQVMGDLDDVGIRLRDHLAALVEQAAAETKRVG